MLQSYQQQILYFISLISIVTLQNCNIFYQENCAFAKNNSKSQVSPFCKKILLGQKIVLWYQNLATTIVTVLKVLC